MSFNFMSILYILQAEWSAPIKVLEQINYVIMPMFQGIT